MTIDPEFDQINSSPDKKAAQSGFPLETAGDIVVGTVADISSEVGKFENPKTGEKPDIPVVTLTKVKWNGREQSTELVLKGYRAGLRALLTPAIDEGSQGLRVGDRLGVRYNGTSASGVHLYEGGAVAPRSGGDMPAADPGPAAPKTTDPDGIPFQKAI